MPFAIADATTLTEAGYVGEDVENIIVQLLQNADHDVERGAARHRLHRRDRQDRPQERQPLASPATCPARACSRRCSRSSRARSPTSRRKGGRKHPQQDFLQVDTTNILFICGGAFVGLDQIVAAAHRQQTLGFGADIKSKKDYKLGELLEQVQPEDLLKFGLIPEFIGRLPVIATLHELNEDALIDILTKPKNALVKQFQKLFEMDGVKLKFTKGALRGRRARGAHAQHRRPRPARHPRERDARHHVRRALAAGIKEVVINEEVITKGERPIVVLRKEQESA